MKKFLFILFLLCSFTHICFAQKLQVVTTTSVFGNMIEVLGKDSVEVVYLVPKGQNPHIFNPSPSTSQQIKEAQLILINGLQYEEWIKPLLSRIDGNVTIDTITSGIDPISDPGDSTLYNPHAWMNADFGKIYVQNIADALATADPDREAFYRNNERTYLSQLQELDKYIFDAISNLPEDKKVLISAHDALVYYGRRYGLNFVPVAGLYARKIVSTSDLDRTKDLIAKNKVSVIFKENAVDAKAINKIAKDIGVSFVAELYTDALGDKESEANSYLNMLRYNTDVIVKVLMEDKRKDQESGDNTWMFVLLGIAILAIALYGFIRSRE